MESEETELNGSSSTVEKEDVPFYHEEGTPLLKVAAIHESATNEEAYDDEGNDEKNKQNNNIPACSLAFCPATPRWARYGIPLVTLVTHGIFLYGQIAPLTDMAVHEHVDVWLNATTTISQDAFARIGWEHQQHFVTNVDNVSRTITFMMGIENLWDESGVSGVFFPRFFAAWGFMFSGVWPHLKLWLLLLVWHAPFYNSNAHKDFEQRRRQRTLHWLSFFGKWSCLSEVLIACQMLGVLVLEWKLDAGTEDDEIRREIESNSYLFLEFFEYVQNSTTACEAFQGLETCTSTTGAVGAIAGLDTMAGCIACQISTEQLEYEGRDILNGLDVSGGINVQLEVAGLVGIYFFCVAVILSVLLNVLVEVMDFKARSYYALLAKRSNKSPSFVGSDYSWVDSDIDNSYQNAPLKFSKRREEDESPLNVRDYAYCAFSIGVAVLVFAGIFIDTMERDVNGTYPSVLWFLFGNDLDQEYSLAHLMMTTDAGGGWDFLLMLIFGLFVLLGPMVQAFLIILRAFNRILRAKGIEWVSAYTIKRWITFVNNFVALDVFCFASMVVSMLITSSSNDFFTGCTRALNAAKSNLQITSNDDECIEVRFVLTAIYWLFVGGGAVALAVAAIDATSFKAKDTSSESND